jgi:hypothetical protein
MWKPLRSGRLPTRGNEQIAKEKRRTHKLELADEVGSDAIPDAAGGEGGHGAAKPDGVIHRYLFYLS